MSNFRTLAPSNQRAFNSSDSSVSKGGGESSKSGSTTRTSREATDNKSDGGDGQEDDDGDKKRGGMLEQRTRERRPPGSVAGRACNECRQARQKCDGMKLPSRLIQTPCSRCQQRKLKCIFAETTKMQKASLIDELRNVHNFNDELQSEIVKYESMTQDLSESHGWRGDILRSIGSTGYEGEVMTRLKAGQSYQQIAEWLRHKVPELVLRDAEIESTRSLIDLVKIFEAECQERTDGMALDGLLISKSPWTDVSTDVNLINHLLGLYFAYVHPIHLLFSEWEFRSCFVNGDTTQCARSLVNAMCAMGCFLYESQSVNDSRFIDLQKTKRAAILRKAFLDEAKSDLDASSLRSLTSVQTFAVMYLIELSAGNARTGFGYLEAALDGLSAFKESSESNSSKELTYWGVRNLKIFCEGSTYRTMHHSFPEYSIEFKGVDLNPDNDIGYRYYQSNREDIPRRVATVSELTAFHQTKLFRVVENNLRVYHGRPQSITAEVACNQYRQYVAWEQRLPPFCRETTIGDGQIDPPLPHIFYLHVLYHTSIVQHLMPIVQSGFFQNTDLDDFRDLVVSHAWKGLDLLRLAEAIYTSRFCLPLISFCTIFLGDALVVQAPHLSKGPLHRSSSEAVKTCLELLQQTRQGFALCGPLQKLLCDRAIECGVPFPDNIQEILESLGQYGIDSFLDACSRLTFVLPFDRLIPRIDPRIANDWPTAWQRSQSERTVKIASLLNDE